MSSRSGAAGEVVQHDLNSLTLPYSRVLRVIGQDIAGFFPKALEITTEGNCFTAQGQCHPNPFEAVKESFLNRIWRRMAQGATLATSLENQAAACFTRSYDAADIEQLDRLQSADRQEAARRADAYSLAERFRVLGEIVDKRNGCLKRLHKDADRLSIEYWDAQGQLQCAKLTTVIFYRNQHLPDASRQNTPAELWEGYDF